MLVHLNLHVRGFRDYVGPLFLRHPGVGVELVGLDPDDVVGITEVPSGGGHSKVIASGQLDVGDGEARCPGPLVVEVVGHAQFVVLVPHGEPSFVVEVPELDLAAPYHGEAPVLIMVVLQTAVVDHGREVGVLVLVGTQVVAVRVRHYAQPW